MVTGLLVFHDTPLDEVAAHLVHRLRRQFAVTGDPRHAELVDMVEHCVPAAVDVHPIGPAAALPVRLRSDEGEVTLLSVVSTFGSALDVTTAELTIETFYDVSGAPDR